MKKLLMTISCIALLGSSFCAQGSEQHHEVPSQGRGSDVRQESFDQQNPKAKKLDDTEGSRLGRSSESLASRQYKVLEVI